jgi:hypothetical protein
MGLRFQKRLRLFKGLTLNLSKTGTSWTIGGRGASINLKDGKATGNVGIPGTGLSYRSKLTGSSNTPEPKVLTETKGSSGLGVIILAIVLIALGYFIGKAS